MSDPLDEVEADRPPVGEGSPIHPICDACAAFVNREDVQFAPAYRGDTCCWTDRFPRSECQVDSRGKYVTAPHGEVHAVWLH